MLKRHRVQGGEDAVERIVGGKAIGELQAQGAEPSFLGDAKVGNRIPRAGATQDGGQSDDENSTEVVALTEGGMTGVGEVDEVMGDVQTVLIIHRNGAVSSLTERRLSHHLTK